MTRSELKQLIRETIEEITADTAAQASDKASDLGRESQANRLFMASIKKDPSIKVDISTWGHDVTGKIVGLTQAPDGRPAIHLTYRGVDVYVVDGDPLVTTHDGKPFRVDRQGRMKLVAGFKAMGVNMNANKINLTKY